MHTIIAGTTGCGKTTRALKMIETYECSGIRCAVLDPIGDVRYRKAGASYHTTSPSDFMGVVNHPDSQGLALFIDESGEAIGRYNEEMQALATRIRHKGHKSHFLVQGARQVARIVRSQCSEIYLFAVNDDDAKLFASDFACKGLLDAPKLGRFEFFHYQRFGQLRKGKS